MRRRNIRTLNISFLVDITAAMSRDTIRILAITLLSVSLSALIGCETPNRDQFVTTRLDRFMTAPRIRIGSLASPFLGTKYIEVDQLGKHGYASRAYENNGIIYTCRAGHIDIAHVRNNADWTAHLSAVAYDHLRKNHTYFHFKTGEDSIYHVQLEYPAHWNKLSPVSKYKAMKEVSIGLGRYFTYISGVWHEVVTWFGYKSYGVYSEFHSAFSWEDTFSNVLGDFLGEQSLLDTTGTYDEAMTMLLKQYLGMLDPQPAKVGEEAAKMLEGKWFSNGFLHVNMYRRNYDIGFADGLITPATIPYGCQTEDQTPIQIRVPNTDFLKDHGFSMQLEIEPREWEKNKILEVVYPGGDAAGERIDPRRHLMTILNHIEKVDTQKYGRKENWDDLK